LQHLLLCLQLLLRFRLPFHISNSRKPFDFLLIQDAVDIVAPSPQYRQWRFKDAMENQDVFVSTSL
jgi:hypothetical protein